MEQEENKPHKKYSHYLPSMKVRSIRFHRDLDKAFTEISKQEGKTFNELVRKACWEFLRNNYKEEKD